MTASAFVRAAEQAAEEQGEDVGVDVEDIFELEGMHELDLNATPEQLERLRQERQAAGRGGWEGGAKHAAAAAGAEGQPQQPASVQAQVDETADKLDSLMELTFAHLERRCLAPGGGGPTQVRRPCRGAVAAVAAAPRRGALLRVGVCPRGPLQASW